LREFLREWRREMAKEQNAPAYVVMHDTTLDAICAVRPSSIQDLLRITGIGERKAELYGRPILDTLARFKAGARAAREEKRMTPSEETIQLIEQGKSLEEIAAIRGRQRSTIVSMVADLIERGLVEFRPEWVNAESRTKIEEVASRLGVERLTPIKEGLPPEVTYEDIRLVVANLRLGSGEQSLAAGS
jgi:ATP-dependent DNA helicase RecQ